MIKVDEITRSFGERRVLDRVSFEVASGRMTGFVGGNGAGKTTTMRVMLGVLTPDSGTVTMNGHPITGRERARFGYMPEERGLYPKMKVAEQLVYLGRLHGLTTADAKRSTAELVERLGIEERANDALESLSLGNQQRAQIAAALVHRPTALVLDEPFSGLDPMAVDVVLGVLREYAQQGAPVLFSSHQLDIVERLCDDVVVIADGQIRAAGSREGLRKQHQGNGYELVFADDSDEHADTAWARELPGIDIESSGNGRIRFNARTPETAQTVLAAAIQQSASGGSTVESFAPVRPSLAQIFKEVIQ